MKQDDDGNFEEADAYNPFMRGIMEFDDYNYKVHNPYVLVEDPKLAEAEPLAEKKEPPKLYAVDKAARDCTERSLSCKNLDMSVEKDYVHDIITIKPSEMELEKERLAREA